MNRAEFFAVLLRELSSLPQEELQNALVYYTEYFDDAGVENEQRVISELGDPAVIAAQILADYGVKNPQFLTLPRKKGFAWWWIVLGVFAFPVALPLIIAAAAVAFSLVIAVGAVVFAFWVVAFVLFVIGVALFFVSFTLLPFTGLGAFFVLGTGMVLTGLGILSGLGMIYLTIAFGKGIAALARLMIPGKKGGAAL